MIITSDVTVKLRKVCGSDLGICESAWVSSGNQEIDATEKRQRGLIRALVRDKHGCYDKDTEVLTKRGWVPWPTATIEDEYATLNLKTNAVEYQKPSRIINKPVKENLIRIKKRHVDLLVTKDHKLLVSQLSGRDWKPYELVPACDVVQSTFRIRRNGAEHTHRKKYSHDLMRLLGFVIGDGCVAKGGAVSFHLRRSDKIENLRELCRKCGFTLSENQKNDTYYIGVQEEAKKFFLETYTKERKRCIPEELLETADCESLEALLEGLLLADGHRDPRGRISLSTSSLFLANQLQQLAFVCGTVASVSHRTHDQSSFSPNTPYYVVQIMLKGKRNHLEPRIGWTRSEREKEITYEPYEGIVYCVTVPNGTLYVRRNGKPCWCGNSPTEEGFLSFYIEAPRAVRDEHVRHRIGSYSSSSLRYKMETPVFYLPPPHRPLKKAAGFKQIQPIYVPYSDEEYQRYREIIIESYQNTAQTLDKLFQEGYTETEARRWVTTDSLMTPYIARFNPRSLINFLSLRTHDEAANHVSFPMWEIEQVARQMESCLKEYFPLLYEAWNEFGREAL